MTQTYQIEQPYPQFTDVDGTPLEDGQIYIGIPGQNPETNPIAIYWDAAATLPAAQPVRTIDGYVYRGGTPASIYIPFGSSYSITVKNKKGNVVYSSLNSQTFSLIQFTQEGTGAVTRTLQEKAIEWVTLQDYGGDPTGAISSSPALQDALDNGKGVVITPGNWLFTPGAVTYTGTVNIVGMGSLSRILCDGTVFTINNGDGSVVDNLYMENVTAPWIISRDPSNWSAVPAVVQSNADGYQPTVNDQDVWSSLTAAQQSQNIGPTIVFAQNASDIQVSRIYGRFVSILMYDTIRSVVRDCDFRAGKNFGGGIIFWNINDQPGYHNKAINNHVRYASFCGVMFARNFDGLIQGNQVEYVGESGVKTYQNDVAGKDARCYHMTVVDNYTKFSYFDGLDLSTDYPHLGTTDSRHCITGNATYGNRQTGFYADGRNNQFSNNWARGNGLSGIYLTYGYSQIEGNYSQDNNTRLVGSGHHDMNLSGCENCGIVGNYIQALTGAPGYALYAPGTNYCANNYAVQGGLFFGVPGSITATLVNNKDSTTTQMAVTLPQKIRQNAGGVAGLTLYSETAAFDNIDLKFHPRASALANPIAQVRGQLTIGSSGAENGQLEGYAAQGGALVPGWKVQTHNTLAGKAWTAIYAPNASVVTSDTPNGSVAMWLDEAGNNLKFAVKYAGGTVKTGTVALI